MQLGTPTPVPASPDDAVLDRVPNPNPGHDYLVRFACPEFTSICPDDGAARLCPYRARLRA